MLNECGANPHLAPSARPLEKRAGLQAAQERTHPEGRQKKPHNVVAWYVRHSPQQQEQPVTSEQNTIAIFGSVRIIKNAVTKATPTPTRWASIRAFNIPTLQACCLIGPYRVLQVMSALDRCPRGQTSAAASLGVVSAAFPSRSTERIRAVSWQFGNDGHRTHSLQTA